MVIEREKIQNPLLRGFLNQEDNIQLYEEFLNNNSNEIKYTLNKRFTMFYYKIRLVSYFSKLIEFEAIKYDKKFREHNKRYNLILDKPTEYGNKDNLVDLLKDDSHNEVILTSHKLEDFIEPTSLKSLTDKQKNILYLVYIKNLKDTEISKLSGVSQQSITKTKQTALRKLRRVLNVQ